MQRILRVRDGVKRFDRRLVFFCALFGDEGGVVPLDVRESTSMMLHRSRVAKVQWMLPG